ncbi:hypothetical protein OG884_15495 [Streptosporangium sp. NBC_01755]|uniref:hypothetical protein n=1 Tax=Streptosporangium sp. NBC_01755 TaxID=2975949 RepID=UPI002DDB9FAD|nr:hypothetical protein [Streptosporangium sp. NBC_01755]WSD03238.1 hypothetical protein OG884_15495 [Streptosporangium sp. NBC_01755]
MATYISCTTGALALYAQEDGSVLAVPVEAWECEAGTPYVAGPTHLVAAHSRPGFVRLEQSVVVVPVTQEPKQPVRGTRPAPRPAPREAREGRA